MRWPTLILAGLLGSSLAAACETRGSQGPSCTYALSASQFDFGAPGGSGSIAVTTTSRCAWSARAETGWLQITGGASGTGTGTVTFAVDPNAAGAARAGALTVAGHGVTVNQAGAPACSFSIAPVSATYDETGGSGAVTVTTGPGCAWTATSGAVWLTITAGGSGSGTGAVDYTVGRNTDTAGRTASMAIAGQSFAVVQAGDVERCEYSIAPVDFDLCMAGRELTSTITTSPACPWTATSGAPWMVVTDGSTGHGSGLLTFRVSDNWEPPRLGIVMIRWPAPTAGQNLQVRQAGCYYAVTQSSFAFTSGGGSGTFDVLQQSDPISCGGPLQNACVWSAASSVPWITITTSMPRSGDDRVSFSVASNDASTTRSGQISVRDQIVVVTQAGR